MEVIQYYVTFCDKALISSATLFAAFQDCEDDEEYSQQCIGHCDYRQLL